MDETIYSLERIKDCLLLQHCVVTSEAVQNVRFNQFWDV